MTSSGKKKSVLAAIKIGDYPASHRRASLFSSIPPKAGMTMYDKIVRDHTIATEDNGTKLVFIDRHMVHEVTSPQAFEALRLAGRNVRRPDNTLA